MKAVNEEFEHQGVFYRTIQASCDNCCFSVPGNCVAPCTDGDVFACNEVAFVIASKKGQKNCECAQKDCKNQGANYWHRINKEYFCEVCAEIISKLMAEDIALVCSDGKLLVREA